MTKIGILLGCVLLAACGGSKKGTTAPPMVTESTPTEDTSTAVAEPTPEPVADQQPAQETPPAPEPVAEEPVAQVAMAELKAVKDDSAIGTLTFERGPDGQITINGQFSGLKKKGQHAFYIHENGDCSNKGKKVGGHLNPTKAKHGPPASAERHAGDFGNLIADETGSATFTMTTDSVTLEADRPDSVVNRTIVIHMNKDDKKGNGGPALACGVIQMKSS